MNGEGISDGLSPERTVEIRVRKNGRKDKVIIETSAAEGLPEGWIKKLEITYKPGRKYRRDAFFIDPKSEYVFQSFKDATRYVETGDIGQYARKLKESDIEDDDSGNGKTVRCLDSVEKRSSDSLLENEKKTDSHVRNSKRRNISSCDELTGNCKMNSELSSVTSQVLEDLVKAETKDPIKKQPIVKRVTRSQVKACKNEEAADLKRKILSSSNAKSEDCVESRLSSARSKDPGKESVVKEEEVQNSTGKWTKTSKATVQTNKLSNSVGVARRASKRLAGIELEPTPELKTGPKAKRIVTLDDYPTPELKTRPKAQQIVSPDEEPTPELKTRPKAQQIVTPDEEPTPELKTRPKAQRIVTPEDEPMPELNTRTKAPQKVPPDNELMPERKTRIRAQQIVTPGAEQTPELNRKTKAQRKVPPINELMPERKRRTRAQRIVPPYNGTSGKCKPYDATATNNNVDAEMTVGNEKFSKPVGRNSSRDKKIKMPAMMFELNPFFHLDGYEPKEESSPVSLLSRQTSATKHEKTASPVSPLPRQTSATKHEKTVSRVSPLPHQTSATMREKSAEGKRLGQSSQKTKLTTSVKVTEIPPSESSSKGKYLHLSDSSNANQRSNKLGNELSQPYVVRGACSELMEKNTTNSFTSDSALADLWKDPCIAFAIKTLTGDSISLPNTTPISSDPMNNHTKQNGVSFFPETDETGNSCAPKPFPIKTLTGNCISLPNTAAISSDPMNNHNKQKGVSFLPERHETVNSCPEKPGFPSAPSGAADLWTDPCIDFAIKTLTGAIPVGLDEPDAKSKSKGMMMTSTSAATKESEGRRIN